MQRILREFRSLLNLRVFIFRKWLTTIGLWLKDKFNPPLYRTSPAKVGAITCTLNEASCIAFTVGALLDHVDLYVLIDTGSTDGTEELIRELYKDEIEAGKLVVRQLGRLPDFDISIARNEALKILREHHVDFLIKADGDDVFYDKGAESLVRYLRYAPENLVSYYCGNHELYQWKLQDSRSWLRAFDGRLPLFWRMGFRPTHLRGFKVAGTHAAGRWTDEAEGGEPETFHSDSTGIHRGTFKPYAAHYGWAKPVLEKHR